MSVADRLASLTPEQRALFEALRQKELESVPAAPPPIERVSGLRGVGDWPLTFDQERLWFLYVLDPSSTASNMITATRLLGDLGDRGVAALKTALNGVVDRHGVWRTTFPVVDGRPVQRVAPERHLPLPVVDLCALPAEAREAAVLGLAKDDARRPFSLERGPLVRVTLARLCPREHVCLVAVHHIVSDLVSFQLFWGELARLYARPGSSLPSLPVQFADFAVWQREWLAGDVLHRELGWWREQLRGFPLVLDLPADHPRPPEPTGRGGRHPVLLDAGRTQALRALARQEKATRFMVLCALAAALFHRLSGQERLITGTLNANRGRPEVEPLIGFFLTQLPLAVDLSGDPTFRELLGRVRAVALGAFAHQHLPFGKLVEALQPERDTRRMPVVQALVQLLDAQSGANAGAALGDLAIESLDVFDGNTRYDLMLGLFEHADTIAGPLEYDADLFDRTTVARMAELLATLLDAAAADPGLRLSALPAFTAAARHQVLVEWNDTALPEEPADLLDLFAAQASLAPEATAWEGEGWSLTYAELDARSNRLARHLRRLGLGLEDLVGIHLDRTAELPVALLGVLKSGAAYLPLDLAHPVERRAFMLEDAGVVAVLTQERLLDSLRGTGARRICLDTGWEQIARESAAPVPGLASPDNRAYVIYTSGSTGRPKGVEIPRRALANFVRAMRRLYTVGPGDAMPGITTAAFDLSVPEIYLPMLGGGVTPLLSRDTAGDGVLLARALEAFRATLLQATPATWQMLLESGWPGGPGMLLLTGAEALSRDLADRLLPLCRGLWNFYGPTETTVWSTAWRVTTGEPISIGRPIAETRIYLLDRAFAPVPLGAAGEVTIGGLGVARGYLRRPGLTAERFIPDPLVGESGARLYRTGDLARLRPDGLMESLGRIDHQVKVRGFRIELGEIEAALRRHPAISEAVVLLREDRPGDPRLTAYLGLASGGEALAPAPAPAIAITEFRRSLAERLPDYMIPTDFVPLPALPRNANGKLDRKALAAIRSSGATSGAPRIAPRTPIEEVLAGLWAEVLEIPRTSQISQISQIGVFDDFFDLGGHSLLATRLVMRVRDALGVELPLRAIFQAPTLAAQAERVAKARGGEQAPHARPIRRVPRAPGDSNGNGDGDGDGDSDLPLSFAQERLWFLDQLTPGNPAYNVAAVFDVRGPLDVPALERAFAEVVRRHEILRTSFPSRRAHPAHPVQAIASPAGWALPVEDLASQPDAVAAVATEALQPFDLASGPLLRTRLLRIAPEHHVLLLTLHHIAADLWGIGVLIREVAQIYAGAELPELPVQYADFAVWQREWLGGAELERQLGFWRRELEGAPCALELPTDRPRPPLESFRGASLPVALGAEHGELSRSLQALGRARGATPFMVMTAALAILFSRWTGQDDVVLGSPVANRPVLELEGLIGMFVNTLALRVRLAGIETFEDLLAGVRRTSLDAFEHQDLPFEKLVEELKPRRDLSRHPLFQAVLAFQNVQQETVRVPGLVLEPLSVESATTKFDLTFTLFEGEDGLEGQVEYATDLFDAATALRLLGHLRILLAGIAADPGTPIEDLPLLGRQERSQLLAWSGTPFVHPPEATIHGLFAEQVAQTPCAVAVVYEDEALTYAELARRATRIAARLLRLGVAPETPVAVMGERSFDLIAALLGILQAGCAYLPLDPEHPVERQTLLLAEAGASLLLAGDLAGDEDEEEENAAVFSPPPVCPDQLAYVMYTSGSTGVPKGVAVTHRNVVRLVRGQLRGSGGVGSVGGIGGIGGIGGMEMGPEQTFLQLAPLAFDASTLEIWAPLLNGGRVVLFPGRRASLEEIGEAIARHGVTSLWLTAGLFHQMVDARPEALRPLRQLLAGGDVLSPGHVRRALAALPGVTLINGYGPTENTTFTACHVLPADPPTSTVPLGRPIGGTRVYVLDANLRPVPEGVWGELFAGGDGVARGYLGRPELTAERFLPDPCGPEPGGRLYRTGDLVRWRSGVLELLGRRDFQVKIRGHRVELGEVEVALTRHEAVREAVVLLREDRPGDRRLAAYVTGEPGTEPDGAELRRFLCARLPEPMIPSAFVVLGRLPLTPSGKVDRRALPAPEGAEPAPGYVAPETPVEESLTAACAEVLGLERVGVRDNFFALGGHSLLATQLVARLREPYGLDVPLQMVFDAADLRELGDRIVERELAAAGDSLLSELLAEGVE